MAPKVEFEGKNVDAAVEQACRELKIEKEQLKYDVLSYGATGIFGIVGAKKAKIRVKGPGAAKTGAAKKGAPGNRKKPPPAESDKEDTGKIEGKPRKETKPEKKEAPPPPEIPSERAPKDPAKNRAADDGAAAAENEPLEEERVSLAELEAAASTGKEMLQRILDAISDDSRISVELDGNRIYYDVKGENPAVLIGKRGQTLEAIQYLVEKAVNQQQKRRIRIVVDVEGYWENRRASLADMALRMAEKSKETGKPIALGQMNAQDRRTVHLTLKEDPTVKTQSRGEGFFRKLVIFPRKDTQRKS